MVRMGKQRRWRLRPGLRAGPRLQTAAPRRPNGTKSPQRHRTTPRVPKIYIHSLEEIRSFFDGLELVPPGVVAVRLWNGDGPPLDVNAPTATFIGGAARKP